MRALISRSSVLRSLLAFAVLGGSAWAVQAQSGNDKVLRVTAIPDESPTELARKAAPLVKYLSEKLGRKVEFTPVTDYSAAVETLINGKIDLAWFGGFTFVQANARSGGNVIPLVQRDEDERFKSVFITADPAIKSLADLKGKTLSFGSQSSTSGHLMPRSSLLAAGIEPDRDLKRVAFSGAHDATVAAVSSGKVDAGALNISVWEKLIEAKRVDTSRVHVFYTTPAYYDYNWSVSSSMPEATREKIRQALLDLDPKTPEGKAVLDLQRATRFIPTKPENYKGIEAAAKNAGLL